MPPKQKILKDDIIKAGFEIMRSSGLSAVNARAICSKLNCSTQPVFSSFSTMDKLKKALIRKARDLYNEYICEALKDKLPFKACGTAYIKFAKDEPILFSILFMNSQNNEPSSEEYDENHDTILSVASVSTGLSKKDTEDLYFHLWIYVHGIAALTATNTLQFSDKQISEMLTCAYNGFISNYKGVNS